MSRITLSSSAAHRHPLTLPSECQAHEWPRGGGGGRRRGRMGGTVMFCETPLFLTHERDCGARLGFVSVFKHDH